MDLYVMDLQFNWLDIVEGAESKIWRRAYADAGYFEIYTADTADNRDLLQIGRCIVRRDDDMVGVIEHVNQQQDDDGRHMLLVSGRCAKSLFARRVIYPQTTFVGSVWNRMYWMLYKNAVAPTDERRQIPHTAIADYDGTSGPSGETQHTGTNLMTAVCDLVSSNNLGWAVTQDGNVFTAALISGIDRTIDQTVRDPVVFADDFDNLISLTYDKDMTNYANVAAIAGEGEGTDRTWTGVDATGTASGKYAGLDRYEMFVDARDVQRTTTDHNGTETTLSDSAYTAALQARGLEKLQESGKTETLEGDVDTDRYVYRVDYNVGDLVTVRGSNGVTANARITAVEEIEDGDGYTITPEFSDYVITDADEIRILDAVTATDLPAWAGAAALQAVDVARSYWDARLGGYVTWAYVNGQGVFDGVLSNANGYGVIDCSTYIGLVLRGIDFTHSPYAAIAGANQTCDASEIVARPELYAWADTNMDGHPTTEYTNGRVEVAADIAKYMWDHDRCFSDPALVRPGDLTFHAAQYDDGSYHIENRWQHISHVGIVAEDGWDDNEAYTFYNATNVTNAVVRSRASARSDTVFFARPDYGTAKMFDPSVNLLTYPWHSNGGMFNGMVAAVGDDGTITFTGKPSASTTYSLIKSGYPLQLDAGTYHVQGCPERADVAGTWTWGLVVRDDTADVELAWDLGAGADFTITKHTAARVYIYISSLRTPDGYVWRPQIYRTA